MSNAAGGQPSRIDRSLLVAFYASLIVVPWIWATLMPLMLIAACFISGTEAGLEASIVRAVGYKIEVLSDLGPVAAAYVVLGNLMVFGIAIVVCWLLTRVWTAKRVYCVLLCALLAPSIIEWQSRFAMLSPVIAQSDAFRDAWMEGADDLDAYLKQIPEPRAHTHVPFLGPYTWETFVWSYHPLALLGIPAGVLVAMLPIFRPGPRYYLRRGLCPKCEYDLRGEIDAGCPECGWNRPAASFDTKAQAPGEE